MPLFVTYASYSNTGIKGMLDKPADRTEAIKTLVEKAGGKLVAAYMTTGPHDVVIVTELADGSDAVAFGMAAGASGAVAKIETVRAWTLGEFKGIAEKASRYAAVYVPPGR
ncbi:GYD domain-containing protein [Bradyrhizobium lablabi]|uniref:GYD domain-containing protein n=1 Tax=Bradyrhizobium lablabi TaxID=722472 RepID=UPI001BA52804|nr:GYD domain-containing protein [Bradyrhizobium lablabi]MBR0694440.1 GYD domain-containing protein [Bradyrhizobium lablabi]